jgi:hypothetical protein
MEAGPPPGIYQDPTDPTRQRYWDGTSWGQRLPVPGMNNESQMVSAPSSPVLGQDGQTAGSPQEAIVEARKTLESDRASRERAFRMLVLLALAIAGVLLLPQLAATRLEASGVWSRLGQGHWRLLALPFAVAFFVAANLLADIFSGPTRISLNTTQGGLKLDATGRLEIEPTIGGIFPTFRRWRRTLELPTGSYRFAVGAYGVELTSFRVPSARKLRRAERRGARVTLVPGKAYRMPGSGIRPAEEPAWEMRSDNMPSHALTTEEMVARLNGFLSKHNLLFVG